MPETARTHEKSDASASHLAWFGVGIIVAVVLIALGVVGFQSRLERLRPGLSAASRIGAQHLVGPAPQLQADPATDLQHMRADDSAVLNSYGWVDRPAGIIRIPIERAMQLTIERGLPVRATPPGKERAP